MQNVDKWGWLGIEVCFFFFFLGCAWATLVFKNYQKR